jgi:hypothetical protein
MSRSNILSVYNKMLLTESLIISTVRIGVVANVLTPSFSSFLNGYHRGSTSVRTLSVSLDNAPFVPRFFSKAGFRVHYITTVIGCGLTSLTTTRSYTVIETTIRRASIYTSTNAGGT